MCKLLIQRGIQGCRSTPVAVRPEFDNARRVNTSFTTDVRVEGAGSIGRSKFMRGVGWYEKVHQNKLPKLRASDHVLRVRFHYPTGRPAFQALHRRGYFVLSFYNAMGETTEIGAIRKKWLKQRS